MKRATTIAGALVAAFAILGAITQAWLSHAASRSYPPPGRLIDVHGHKMHMLCTGHGDRTVVLVSGLGGWSLDWSLVQPMISSTATVCSYDRPGFGWSEPYASSLTPEGIVADLHELLHRGRVTSPYVLVGQSVGGIYARLFAERYPSEVISMVFVDSSHEEQFSRYPTVARAERSQLRLLRFVRYLAPFGVGRLLGQPVAEKSLPGRIGEEARAIGFRTGNYFAFYDEASRLLHASDQLHLPATLNLPIVVLTGGSHIQQRADGKQWAALQRELVGLSPCGTQVIVNGAGHNIEVDDPAAVVAAINDILTREDHVCER